MANYGAQQEPSQQRTKGAKKKKEYGVAKKQCQPKKTADERTHGVARTRPPLAQLVSLHAETTPSARRRRCHAWTASSSG